MRRIITFGAVLALLVVAYTGAWVWAASFATTQVKALATADGETMPRITCDKLSVGGFPFGFDLTCDGGTLVQGDVTVTVAGLQGSVQVYSPFHVLVAAHAPLTIADAFTGEGMDELKEILCQPSTSAI